MSLGPAFWRRDEPTLMEYPHGWPERIAADVRGRDQWMLGGYLHNPYRVLWIRNAQDWRTLMHPTLARYPMPYGESV